MKKLCLRLALGIFACCLAALMAPGMAQAAGADDFYYVVGPHKVITGYSGNNVYGVVSGANDVVITGYHGQSASVVVPATIGGRPVVAIGEEAFSGSYITSIKLPSSIHTVGYSAFGDCMNLASVSFSSGIKTIGDFAFQGCWSLGTITFPATLKTLGDYSFTYCLGLSSVYFYGNPPPMNEFSPWFMGEFHWAPSEPFDFTTYYHVSRKASWNAFKKNIPASYKDMENEDGGYSFKPFCVVTVSPGNGAADKKIKAAITSSGHISAPAAPKRTGYTFTGWYKDSARRTKWNFKTAKITGDIKVYAGWKMTSGSVPSGVRAASAGYNSVKISWPKVDGATKYYVYRATSKSGSYKKIKETASLAYTCTGLTAGKTYYFKVKAYAGGTGSKYSAAVSAKPVPAKPGSVKAAWASSTSVKLTWKAVNGASGYEIFRTASGESSPKRVKTIAKGTTMSYTNSKLTTGQTYSYKVRAYRTVSGKKVYGSFSSTVRAKP